jgi:SAM-dependent methyltransferase
LKTIGAIMGNGVEASEELRASLRGMWATVAPQWGEHADYVDTRGEAVMTEMLSAAGLAPGERVLELACGPGSVGLAAARLVGPSGQAVLSDGVAEMAAIAAARATDFGLTNVSTCVLDLQEIDQPDASFDAVVCRDGLQFAPDPGRAVAEIHRVLRPGGRAVIVTWGPRAANPWLGVVLDSVSAQLGAPMPPPGIPGPFSLDDPVALGALLTDAGLESVSVTELSVPMRTASFEEWWTRTTALAGPLAGILATLPAEVIDALRVRVEEAVRPYETPTGLELPGLGLLASGQRV